VTFQIDDIEEEWTFSHNFDYIHSRFMNSSIANWRDLFKRSLEYDVPFYATSPIVANPYS
jgi:hypothetical protein